MRTMQASCQLTVGAPKLWLRDRSRFRSPVVGSLLRDAVRVGHNCGGPGGQATQAVHSTGVCSQGWGHRRATSRGLCMRTSSSSEPGNTERGSGSGDVAPAPEAGSQGLLAVLAQASSLLPYAVLASALLSLCVLTTPTLARHQR